MNEAAVLTRFSRHGGRLAAAREAFPAAPTPWLDLSTGVNPRPYPAPRAGAIARSRLPDPESLAALEAVAARAFGVAPQRVAATPGSEAALRLLPDLLGVRRVAIAADTYGGHREAWETAGAEVSASPHPAEAWVVVRPNNPDGRVTPEAELRASAERRWTVVDEAFADAAPQISLAPQAAGRLVVLRSFGKFYGLAGLRLGFVIADEALIGRLRRRLGDWPVCAEAIAAGLAAYADGPWAARMRRRLAREARRLDGLLEAAGLEVVGGTSLFRLAQAKDARALFLRLARAGVLCRPFDDPHRLRFGLPGRPAEWSRLEAALTGDTP